MTKKTVPKEAQLPIRAVVVLSDLHCGSTKALLPPGFVTLEGNEVDQNVAQEWLWECWIRANNFIDSTIGKSPFALVLNGDLLEGIHHGTKEIISPEMADHRRACMDTIQPLAKRAAKVFVVRGTEAHVNNHEAGIGEQLNAVKNPELGIHAFDRLTLDVHGTRCVFRHHIGTTTQRGLAGTAMSRQLEQEQVEAACNGEIVPRVLVCSHRHVPGSYRTDSGLCMITPAWQILTRFSHKVVSQARCKPGVQILDWRNFGLGELPQIHEKYFATPQPSAITL